MQTNFRTTDNGAQGSEQYCIGTSRYMHKHTHSLSHIQTHTHIHTHLTLHKTERVLEARQQMMCRGRDREY